MQARTRIDTERWRFVLTRALRLLQISGCALSLACAESTRGEEVSPPASADAGDGGDGVHVRFDPSDGRLPFGAVPWPDDLYLQNGRVALGALPQNTMQTDYARVLHGSLSELDGFGIAAPIYFYLDGEIDPDTLPHSAAESEGMRSGVFLVDADTASPEAYQRVRAEVQWSAELSRLAVRPAAGHPLTPGRRYAALVTRKVKDTRGRPLAASAKFAAVRDATSTLTDPALLRARANYAPVLETLTKAKDNMLDREDVVAMAVFRVQTATQDFDDARRIVRGRDAPSASNVVTIVGDELDEAFGAAKKDAAAAAHENLSAVIHGTLPSPNFLSMTAKTHGAWVRDESGALTVKRDEEEVPFSLFLPAASKGSKAASVVIYQHGLGRERGDAVLVANQLAASNIAVIAIDAPFQGMRAKSVEGGGAVDIRNRFTGVAEPDDLGDVEGDFYGEDDKQGQLLALHPFYIRDALRQGVVDLMTVVRFLESDQIAPLTMRAGNAGALDVRRIGFVGEDVGATIGVMLGSFEPKLQALCLVGASAVVAQGFALAASKQPLFDTIASNLGRTTMGLDWISDSPEFWPELALFETLLGRGEPLAYAPTLRRLPVNVLLMTAKDDEVVGNAATEALAVALGAKFLNGDARYVGELTTQTESTGDKVHGNVPIEDAQVTRLLREYDPADHRLLRSDGGQRVYKTPVRPPFVSLDAQEHFDNPRAKALADLQEYFDSFFKCVNDANVSTSAVPCSANVVAP